MTDGMIVEAIREALIAESTRKKTPSIFITDTMTEEELRNLLNYITECEIRYAKAMRNVLKKNGGDVGDSAVQVVTLMIVAEKGMKKYAEDWLSAHVSKKTYDLIHDDVLEDLGVEEGEEK